MDSRSRDTLWYVHTPGARGPAGALIPTLGHPTSAGDLFRVAQLVKTGHEGWNSCFTDFTAPAALARVVEGELKSLDDLYAAEVALQALMWHERVDVLVPAFKCDYGGFSGYARERDPRTQLAFDLFGSSATYDQLFVVESVEAADGVIRRTNIQGSGIVGQTVTAAVDGYLHRASFQAAALSSIPIDFGVPAYFTHPLLRPFSGKRGFFGDFYTSVSRQWEAAVTAVPDVNEIVPVPVLLSIVLDRAASRAAVPDAIHALRQEMEPVRQELTGFSDMLRGAYNQVQVEQRCSDIRASFDAAFAASRMRERSLLLPVLKLFKAAKSPLDPLISALNPDYVPGDPRVLADRTVTAKKFSRLLRVDAMHSMLANMLTEAEMRSLSQSASRAREA